MEQHTTRRLQQRIVLVQVFLLHSLALHAVLNVSVSSCVLYMLTIGYCHMHFVVQGSFSQPQADKEVFMSGDAITLTVKAPDLGCQSVNYFVRDLMSAKDLKSSFLVKNGIATITITGLEAGANYTVQVYAAADQSQERPVGKPVTFQISAGKKTQICLIYYGVVCSNNVIV